MSDLRAIRRGPSAMPKNPRTPGHSRTLIRTHKIAIAGVATLGRSEEHTSELQSLMRISYAGFCLKKKKQISHQPIHKPYYNHTFSFITTHINSHNTNTN